MKTSQFTITLYAKEPPDLQLYPREKLFSIMPAQLVQNQIFIKIKNTKTPKLIKNIVRFLMVLNWVPLICSSTLLCSDPWSCLPCLPPVVRIYGDHHLYRWQVEQAGLLWACWLWPPGQVPRPPCQLLLSRGYHLWQEVHLSVQGTGSACRWETGATV